MNGVVMSVTFLRLLRLLLLLLHFRLLHTSSSPIRRHCSDSVLHAAHLHRAHATAPPLLTPAPWEQQALLAAAIAQHNAAPSAVVAPSQHGKAE